MSRLTNNLSSSFMRRVICYNQGEYAQYNFMAGEFHKALKDSWTECPSDVAHLHELCDQLVSFLNRHLNRVSQQNFAFLKEYFSGKYNNVEPRICIKGNSKEDGEDYIVTIVRDTRVTYLSKHPLKDNSGFSAVKGTGLYFLCNDIPKCITAGAYTNARINTELARAYYEERSQQPAALSDKHDAVVDEAWLKCWNPPTLDAESCYKSTAIIPMTLWNNRLDPEFLNRRATASRAIFGYLCFDHVEENYFDESMDIKDVGYIFADILSLYMITMYIYTEMSETFSDVTRSFSQQEVVAEV